MIVQFESCFEKDLKKINDQAIFHKVSDLISVVKACDSLSELNNVKKLHGPKNYYRIRLGDYRIGIEYSENTVIFVRILHRKDIYRYFP